MSLTFGVEGIVPFDKKKHEAMKAVRDNCEKLGIEEPEEVFEYFDECDEDERGRKVDIEHEVKNPKGSEYTYYEVEVCKLPPEVKIIRFSISC